MAPAWNEIGEMFNAETSSVLIGDVDCTDSGEKLCEQYEIRGYPTIKYFLDGDRKGMDYSGGRDVDSLEKFVRDNLEVPCKIDDQEKCTDKEKAYIAKMQAKSSEERKAQLERLSKMKGDAMKAELKNWLNQRLRILLALEGPSSAEEL
jgi:protein disulfide-isomerase A6